MSRFEEYEDELPKIDAMQKRIADAIMAGGSAASSRVANIALIRVLGAVIAQASSDEQAEIVLAATGVALADQMRSVRRTAYSGRKN